MEFTQTNLQSQKFELIIIVKQIFEAHLVSLNSFVHIDLILPWLYF